MIFYVIDTRSPFTGTGWHLPWTTVKSLKVNGSDTVTGMVTRIAEMVGTDKIETLLLCGHGNSGFLQICKENLTQTNAHLLGPLKDKFQSDGKGIEIHGCGVGSDSNILKGFDKKNNAVCQAGTSGNGTGHQFLKAVATAANTKVTAALNCQYDDATFSFEGPTVTVGP